MIAKIILIAYGFFLIIGGFLGLKKGSKISLLMGLGSGIFVFWGVALMSFSEAKAWIFLTCLNLLLSGTFTARLIKTRSFMPSGMLLIIALAMLFLCAAHLRT